MTNQKPLVIGIIGASTGNMGRHIMELRRGNQLRCRGPGRRSRPTTRLAAASITSELATRHARDAQLATTALEVPFLM